MITYREFAPAPELAGHVRAYFSFMPETPRRGHRPVVRDVVISLEEPFWTPVLADARTSLALDLGAVCRAGKGWAHGTRVGARVIGAQRSVSDETGTARSEMIGVYFEHGASRAFLDPPAVELTDRVVGLEDVWGAATTQWVADIAELDEAARVERLEARLLERLRLRPAPAPWSTVDVPGLARWVQSEPASMTVRRLAEAAGVSRRHLSRVFREVVGLGPKRYCRLARFQAGLRYAGAGRGVNWARVAIELGYADQSHMIAEFRRLGGMTPEALATKRWFHPFILEAKSRLRRPPSSTLSSPRLSARG